MAENRILVNRGDVQRLAVAFLTSRETVRKALSIAPSKTALHQKIRETALKPVNEGGFGGVEIVEVKL